MRIMVTGANGFVGRSLCIESIRRGMQVRGAMRSSCDMPSGVEDAVVGAIDGETNWKNTLHDVDVIIHLAARVHVMKDHAANPLAEFLKVNLQGTANLANQASKACVRRLVYVSSIKVNGESTKAYPFRESDNPDPHDPYAVSKWQAEQELRRISDETGMEVVILRPPLVYGPGVKGNFISLFAAIADGIPLPLNGANNARSLVYVGNLVDALLACATHPAAVGQTYLISDGDAVSTAELVEKIAHALGRNSHSFYFPLALLRAAAALLGRSAKIDRLLNSLLVDDNKLRRELGWTPPYTLEQGLDATAKWYRYLR